MTDREHAARLAGDELLEEFSRLEKAVDDGLDTLFREFTRTLSRTVRKVFAGQPDAYERVERAFLAMLESTGADDFAIHFTTGTSYRFQVKSWAESAEVYSYVTRINAMPVVPGRNLDVPLQPLPPSARAERLLQRAAYALFRPPSALPRYPLAKKQRMYSHLIVDVGDAEEYRGVFRVADKLGDGEISRHYPGGSSDSRRDLDELGLRTFAVFVRPNASCESRCIGALIEPYTEEVISSRPSKVVRSLDVDLLLCLPEGVE
ncbi:hypothetical protein [Streptomyces phaeoluteigriseus]